VDLSVLVENVVDSVFAGHQYRHSMLPSKHQSTLDDNMSTAVSAGNTMIILTMEWRASWMFSSRRGCWKRILINLVGNSLKYTTSGFIHISLRIASIGSPSNAAKEILKLQIEDSGIGMSKDYLDNELYTPFAQENPMSAGTGLGMYIL
jgi:signal transduction histidine kinase